MAEQGEVYAQFVAVELEHERKRRERLEARATATIATSAALLALAAALGIFDPDSLLKQPNLVQGAFFVGAFFVVLSAVLALWAGWLHGYDVLDEEEVWRLLIDDWGDDSDDARGKVAQFNSKTLRSLRPGNDSKALKLVISHVLQFVGLLLLLAVALGTTARSIL